MDGLWDAGGVMAWTMMTSERARLGANPMTVQERLRELLHAKEKEGLRHEWKEGLPTDRTEFLADVTSLANGTGGLLVYCAQEERTGGEKTGRLERLLPQDPVAVAHAQETCENWLADNVEPRIGSVRIHRLDASGLANDDGEVLVIEVGVSWTRPHMVSRGKGRWSMYGRNSYGKRPLDPHEIRAAFLGAASIPDRITALRNELIADIQSRRIPIAEKEAIALQLAPLGWWEGARTIDYAGIVGLGRLRTLTAERAKERLNIDGAFVWQEGGGSQPGYAGYAQYHQSGHVDFVDTEPIGPPPSASPEKSCLAAELLRISLADTLASHGALLDAAGIAEPVVVMLSLINVEGGLLAMDRRYAKHPFDRPVIEIPHVVVDNLSPRTIDRVIVDIMDSIARAAGLKKSPYEYTSD
ncbi:MAG: hypothetical protein Kow0067_06300 [Coriobacteriia bacterium]